LSGLNLSNNLIEDISPLLRIKTLRSLNLSGNNAIPCQDIAELARRMGANFTPPTACAR
jgi:Leucine-rich repeat (LRR) protein